MKTKNLWKKIFKAAVTAVLSLGISSYSLYAQEVADVSILQAVNKLNRNSLWKWQVVADKNSKSPKTLFGSLSDTHEEQPQEIAHNFLYDYPEIFGLEQSSYDYVIKEVLKHAYATYILYVQTYDNIPVENSYLFISVTRNGRVSLVKTKKSHNINISTNPQLSENEAYNIALENAQEKVYVEEPGDIELVILPQQNKFSLAWKIQFKTDRFGGQIKYIINDKGEIIEKVQKRGHVFPIAAVEKNPLLKKKEVIKALISLKNNNLITETKNLLEILCKYEQEPDKKLISESVITADLNISNGRNLSRIIEILRKHNLMEQKSYCSLKLAIRKPNTHLKPVKTQINLNASNRYLQKNIKSIKRPKPTPTLRPRPQTIFAQNGAGALTSTMQLAQLLNSDIQAMITCQYQMMAASFLKPMMSLLLRPNQHQFHRLTLSIQSICNLQIQLTIAKTAKKLADKWDMYVTS